MEKHKELEKALKT